MHYRLKLLQTMKSDHHSPQQASAKYQQLVMLGNQRRENTPAGFYALTDYHGGVYDCEWVSPYTKSASNLNAHVMVLLQDWASDAYLSADVVPALIEFGLDPRLPTSQRLESLLNQHFGLSIADTFGTNLFPFIKPGVMSAPLPMKALQSAAKGYALPQIEIVKPKIVICLGVKVYNAMARTLGIRPARNLTEAIETPICLPLEQDEQCWLFAQAHTGRLGQMARNRGNPDQVAIDWEKMTHFMQAHN